MVVKKVLLQFLVPVLSPLIQQKADNLYAVFEPFPIWPWNTDTEHLQGYIHVGFVKEVQVTSEQAGFWSGQQSVLLLLFLMYLWFLAQ